jgi:hypothetical protein
MTAHLNVVALVKRGLIRQFIGLWPSPHAMDIYFNKIWNVMIQGNLTHYFCGEDIAFSSLKKRRQRFNPPKWAYFVGPRGMYLKC